jgi:xanthine dehydrogenase YagS FAD-binding subunit
MEGRKCFTTFTSDIAVALTALDARIKVACPKGDKTIPIDDFYKTLVNALKADEMVIEIQVPKPPDKAKHIPEIHIEEVH